jgi:hypothetical protein
LLTAAFFIDSEQPFVLGVCINFFTVFAYRHLVRKERLASELRSKGD